jgi:hypothetical protein
MELSNTIKHTILDGTTGPHGKSLTQQIPAVNTCNSTLVCATINLPKGLSRWSGANSTPQALAYCAILMIFYITLLAHMSGGDTSVIQWKPNIQEMTPVGITKGIDSHNVMMQILVNFRTIRISKNYKLVLVQALKGCVNNHYTMIKYKWHNKCSI